MGGWFVGKGPGFGEAGEPAVLRTAANRRGGTGGASLDDAREGGTAANWGWNGRESQLSVHYPRRRRGRSGAKNDFELG